MENAFPNISDEHREHLKKQGLKVYEPTKVHPAINPFKTEYWVHNALLFTMAVLGRRHAGVVGAPRMLWSACIVGIPFYALLSRSKLDSLDEVGGARKTLEQKLEYAPITRRAWERALETNTEYQNALKEQIFQLQAQIAEKKISKK